MLPQAGRRRARNPRGAHGPSTRRLYRSRELQRDRDAECLAPERFAGPPEVDEVEGAQGGERVEIGPQSRKPLEIDRRWSLESNVHVRTWKRRARSFGTHDPHPMYARIEMPSDDASDRLMQRWPLEGISHAASLPRGRGGGQS